MKEWLTAQEIAAEALPQIPCTKRGVNDLAEREGWNLDVFRARKRTGRGGGMEYHIGLLPSLAQVSYRQRSIPVGPLPAAPELQSGAALSGRAALERDARLAILRAYDAFERGQRLNRQGCEALFVSKYQSGTLHVETWVRELVPAFSRRTLARWRAAAAADATRLGHDRGAARKGTGVLDTANAGAVKAWILGLIAHQPHLSAGQIIEQVRGQFGDTIEVVRGGGVIEQIDMPPLRTFQVMLKALKVENEVVLTKLTDPDRFRSHMRLAGIGSMRHVAEPNMLWQIDASPVDALCTDGRHSIYMCIDVASRRVVVYITKTPRAAAVGLLLRKAILAWGVPGQVKIDNGSDFKAKSTQRLLTSLGIEVDFSDAFSPEQKAFVERVIGTFQRGAVTLMPGFIGHNVTDRKAIEGRKSFAQRLGEDDAATFAVQCTAAEMQEHFDAWADLKYQHTPHSNLGKRTPFEVAATAAHTIRRVDERALDLLLAPMAGGDGTRTTTRLGVRVNNVHYLNGSIMPGKRVFVRHDPQDLGRVFLFGTEDGDFLGEALNAEMAGVSPEALVRAERALQGEILAEQTKAIEAVRRQIRKGKPLHQVAREIWLRDQPNVTSFPRPEVAHSTPAIAAALDAVTGRDRVPEVEIADPVAERLMRLRERGRAAPNVTPIRQELDTPELRFRKALEQEARMAAGEEIDPAEAMHLGRYQTTPEYRARRREHDRQQARKGGQ